MGLTTSKAGPIIPLTLLGKIERFWKTIWEEFLVRAQFDSFEQFRPRAGQRLVRVLCSHCKTEDKSDTTAALKALVHFKPSEIVYKAVGCEECRNTGYHGRQGVFEWMDMNNEIRQMLLKNCSSGEIRESAVRAGMRSLSDDGWRLVRQGVTTPEEVMRVTKDQTLELKSGESASLVETILTKKK